MPVAGPWGPLLAAVALATALACGHAQAQAARTGVSAAELFVLAGQASEGRRFAEAERIYEALEHDPSLEIRTEARFRRGLMLAANGRPGAAVASLRRLLAEKPDAARVRLELARILASMDDEDGARREIRRAQASGLPPDVALVVDQFAAALRSDRRYGGSVSVAVAPDSNINRATRARTLDTVFAPLTLDREAQGRSGLGGRASGQAYARWRLSPTVAVLAQVGADASLYRARQFDDVALTASVGPQIKVGADRWRPALGVTRRYYGGDLYSRTGFVSANWLHPLDRRSQLTLDVTVSRNRYGPNPLLDGGAAYARATIERSLGARAGGSLSLQVNRQTARDRGYATGGGGASLFGWRDVARSTVFGSLAASALGADATLFPFTQRRRDRLYRAEGGVILRRYAIRSFSPVVRLVQERNRSTVGLYDFRRTSIELGFDRAF